VSATEITCLIVDDHEVVREGLRLSLSRAPHIRVIGEAGDGESAIALAEEMRERYRAMIYLAVDTGMRWSELVGLRLAHVDTSLRKVRVTEQLVRLKSGEWLRKQPKTAASRRSITIAPFTASLLGAHIEQYTVGDRDALVFTNGACNPLMEPSFLGQHFKPAQARAGVKLRFHDLRHTSVALAIAEGAHPKSIQVRMGHASINVTLDRYGHLFPELDEAIAEAFDRRLVEGARFLASQNHSLARGDSCGEGV